MALPACWCKNCLIYSFVPNLHSQLNLSAHPLTDDILIYGGLNRCDTGRSLGQERGNPKPLFPATGLPDKTAAIPDTSCSRLATKVALEPLKSTVADSVYPGFRHPRKRALVASLWF